MATSERRNGQPPTGIEPERVGDWLIENLPGVEPPLAFEPLQGGRSNLTFAVSDARGWTAVLRRPPLGPLLASAHDVAREHRVMRALADTSVPVPRPLALCEDPSVLGAPFTVMSFVDGLVLRTPEDAQGLPVAARRRAGESVVDALAALHAAEPTAVQPDGRARGADYAQRQLKRWRRQWHATAGDGSVSARIDAIADRLERLVPEQRHTTIVHGDYRLDNVIVSPDGDVRAIVDWELWTFGDPLADLGLMLVYWIESEAQHAPLGAAATTLEGFSTRRELAERYARVSGRDLARLEFWVALGAWKLAIILQGVLQRTRDGSYGAARRDDPWLAVSIEALIAEAEAMLPRAG